MITLVFTYRNRSIHIVKKCLQSLATQSNPDFQVVIVNYGSDSFYSQQIETVTFDYQFVTYIHCDVPKQLWNKSKAINIALKNCATPYFFVADIDMMFRNDFVKKLNQVKSECQINYFQVGFLSESESNLDKPFDDYKIKHVTSPEATGMTLYPTELLKRIHGYDEFYHGWGAEDTDVHTRLQHAGYEVRFFDESLLLLHQWHPKDYRSKESKEPFHSRLEQINHQYVQQTTREKKIVANTLFGWGILPELVDFTTSNKITLSVSNQVLEIEALLYGFLDHYKGQYVCVSIQSHPKYKNLKNAIKQLIGRKHLVFYDFQTINDVLLGHVIARYRNRHYEYEWNKEENSILLKIAL